MNTIKLYIIFTKNYTRGGEIFLPHNFLQMEIFFLLRKIFNTRNFLNKKFSPHPINYIIFYKYCI